MTSKPTRTYLQILTAAFLSVWLTTAPASASDGCWTNRASMPLPMILPQCVEFNGLIYVLAGLDTYDCAPGWTGNMAYNPATDTWHSNTAIMPTRRYNTAAVVSGAYVYCLGGSTGCNSRTPANEAYDPVLNTWVARAPMLSPRSGFAASVINGIVYVTGGTLGDVAPDTSIDAVEAYNPAANSWTTKPPMISRRASHASVSHHGLLYVFGGYDLQNEIPNPEVFDPTINTWRVLPQMPHPRRNVTAFESDGRIFVMGGMGPNGVSDAIDIFDARHEVWLTSVASLPAPRSSFGAAVVNGDVYIMGGWSQPPTFTDTNQILHLDCIPSCPADFNNDGVIDFFDYLDFVAAFSSGC